MPGLMDAHLHLSSSGLVRLTQADLSFPQVKGIGDIVGLAAARAAAAAPGEWVLGRGWDEGKLEERRYLLATDIDPVTDGHPAWLTHTMGHYGTANSTALRLAGIAVWNTDPYTAEPEAIRDMQCRMTLLEGEVVFQAD